MIRSCSSSRVTRSAGSLRLGSRVHSASSRLRASTSSSSSVVSPSVAKLSTSPPPLRSRQPPPLANLKRPARNPTPAAEVVASAPAVGWSPIHRAGQDGLNHHGGDERTPNGVAKVIFQPGTILEALKGQMRIIGVVLDTVILDERLRLRILSPSGAIFYPYPENVLFTFTTNSIPADLVASTGTSDTDMTDDHTKARSKIVGTLRGILTQSTELRTETDPIMDDAWDRFRYHGDGHDDARRRPLVTTAQVTRWVEEETEMRREAVLAYAKKMGKPEPAEIKRRTPVHEETAATKELRLHRVYQSMMGKPEVFIAQETAQWKTEIWRVRSTEDVEEMRQVEQWMKDSDDTKIDSFTEKAQAIIDHTRPQLAAHLGSSSASSPPPALTALDGSLPTWDESDRVIISHMQASFLNSRNQRSPFVSTVPTLLKRIDRYGGVVDVEATNLFLIEIGARAPWDDVGTMFGLMEHGDRAREDDEVKELFAELERTEKTAPPTTTTKADVSLSTYNSLGPNEFYPSDPLASIRHDFGDLRVYVIDDIEASELDDGVSIERSSREGHVWIHAHIADPTTVLHPRHRLSQLASQRASTSYLPQGNFPLLPEELSIERFSLGKNGKLSPGDGQECLTFSAEVNETTGEVGDYKIRAGIIRNIQVTTYATVCAVLGGRRRAASHPLGPPRVRAGPKAVAEPQPEWTPDLQLLLRASRAIAFRRLRHGGLNWSVPSYSVKVGPKPLPSLPLLPGPHPLLAEGSPSVDYEVQEARLDPATEIVQTVMTLAGNIAGRFFADRNLPGPYRAYPSPVGATKDSMAQLLETRNPTTGDVSPFDIARFGVVFLPGGMQPRPGAHWMMGLTKEDGGYVRVTSPLRRYADLLAHWQIKHALLATHILGPSASTLDQTLLNEQEMSRAGVATDAISNLVIQTQRRSLKFWGAYALSRYARTLDPYHGHDAGLPPPQTSIFAPLPSPPAGRLGPYRSVCMGASFLNASDQTRSTVMVLVPELGLTFGATHPTGEGPYGPGEEVRVMVDRAVFGVRAGVEGVVFR